MSKTVIALSDSDGMFTAELPEGVTGSTLLEAFCSLMKGLTYSHSVIQSSLEDVLANYQSESKYIQDNG